MKFVKKKRKKKGNSVKKKEVISHIITREECGAV